MGVKLYVIKAGRYMVEKVSTKLETNSILFGTALFDGIEATIRQASDD